MGSSASEVQKLLQAARLHLAHGQLHEAVAQATEVIRLDAKEPSAYLVRAEAHRRLNRSDRALADLAVGIRLDPQQPGPYLIRAEILKRRNLFDQAIADATYALILDPRHAAAYSVRAECRNAIGDREGAREDMQEMLCIDPTRPVPALEARGASSSSDVEMGNERFWKQAGQPGPKHRLDIFADGKPVDKSYRSRPVVSDEDAPEALGVASGYKPGTIPKSLPRIQGGGTKAPGGGNRTILILGLAITFGCCLWMLIKAGSGPEESPKPAEPQRSQVTRPGSDDEIPNSPRSEPAEKLTPTGHDNDLSKRPSARIARTGVGNDRLPPPPEGKTWVMVWHDEFDGTAVDMAKWTPSPEGGRRSGWWSPKAVSLDGQGHLVVKTYKDGDRYVDGCVTSQGKFEHAYGYYVARVMFQREQGHWAGLWMLSPGVFKVGDGGRDGTEIDIVASAGRDDRVNHSLRWDGYGEAHKTAAKQVHVPGVIDGYHTFGLLWTPEEYVFFVDGRETWRTSAGGVSQVPQYLLISDEVLDSGGGIGQASLPDQFLVDYVRVYDLAEGGVDSASPVARQISPIAAPEIANLTEINTKRTDFCAWPSPDGLTLYWVIDGPGGGEGEIWSARRKDPGSLFSDKRLVGYGRHIAVSADGLTMFLVARRADGELGDSIQVARRRSTREAFGRPQAVPELASIESPRNLFLSADGRTFLFVTGVGDGEAARPWVATRPSPEAPWSTPRPLAISAGPGVEGHVICPHLTADGLTILGVSTRHGGPRPEFVTWTRSGADRPFTGPRPLQLPGVKEFYGWQPRYVEATHELFFCSNRLAADRSDEDIWVVRNFVLPP